jgi:hypothetical protein
MRRLQNCRQVQEVALKKSSQQSSEVAFISKTAAVGKNIADRETEVESWNRFADGNHP